MKKHFLLTLLVVGMVFSVRAHGDAHLLIQEISRQLESDPDNPELYFNRAVLYQSHNDFNQAFLDYQHFISLEPSNTLVYLNLAQLCLDSDLDRMALQYAEQYLEREPNSVKGYMTRGDIHRSMSSLEEALKDYTYAVQSAEAVPDHYFALTETLLEYRPEETATAITLLRDAQQKLGDLTAFREGIIMLETKRGNFDNALVEADLLIERAARKERWYILKGEILQEAGRKEEAADAYVEAQKAIQSLSPTRKNTEFIRALAARIELALADLE